MLNENYDPSICGVFLESSVVVQAKIRTHMLLPARDRDKMKIKIEAQISSRPNEETKVKGNTTKFKRIMVSWPPIGCVRAQKLDKL